MIDWFSAIEAILSPLVTGFYEDLYLVYVGF